MKLTVRTNRLLHLLYKLHQRILFRQWRRRQPPKFQYVAEWEESSMRNAVARLSKRAGVSCTPIGRSPIKVLSAIKSTVRKPKAKAPQARKSIKYMGLLERPIMSSGCKVCGKISDKGFLNVACTRMPMAFDLCFGMTAASSTQHPEASKRSPRS